MTAEGRERAAFSAFKEHINVRRTAKKRRLNLVKARRFECQPVRASRPFGTRVGVNAALFEQQRHFGRGQLQRLGLIAAVGVGLQQSCIDHNAILRFSECI